MFNSTISKLATISLAIAVFMGSSTSAIANADMLILTDLNTTIEQNMAIQMQEMMQVAQRELSMSLQTQLSSSMFDMAGVEQFDQEPEEVVITSAMVKD
ncbi:hypothetical protein HQQ94_06780 [Shewanella sp. VB17]|uniref:hypothetical protein n=1 Tax=Shewanella sp. VB17 TaxID=2739432 RepID=UPI00156496AC|nr:hypothetical protein [Shewanella sp. VB17]NRD72946.1 hypothetical protein [Shewanella sp. VB17]